MGFLSQGFQQSSEEFRSSRLPLRQDEMPNDQPLDGNTVIIHLKMPHLPEHLCHRCAIDPAITGSG